MSDNNVSLSQAEIDKLLGIKTTPVEKVEKKEEKIGKSYSIKTIASEEELAAIKDLCEKTNKEFKKKLKAKFGQPGKRIIKAVSAELMNIDQYFETATNSDFLYKVDFGKEHCFFKVDKFLFLALSGLEFDMKHQINLFQCAAIKHFVVSIFAECLANDLSKNSEIGIPETKSLFKTDTSEFCNGETGICLTVNWNENLKFFGAERIFLTEGLFKKISAFAK